MVAWQYADSTLETDLVKASVGLRYTPMPRTLIPAAGYATVTFTLELPKKPNLPSSEECDGRQRTVNCAFAKAHLGDPEMTRVTNELSKQLDDKYSQLRLMLGGFKMKEQNNAGKRGAFDFIGSISHSLFGTATDAQLKKVYQHMKNITEKASKAESERKTLHKQVTVIADKLDKELGEVVHAIDATASATVKLSNAMGVMKTSLKSVMEQPEDTIRRTRNMTKEIRLTQLMLHRYLIIDSATKQIDDWLEGILRLQQGYLSPKLIPATELAKALDRLETWAQAQSSQFRVYRDPAHMHLYYEMQTARCMYMDRTLVIVAKLPYVANLKTYEVYRVRTFPVPLHGPTEKGQAGYTMVTNAPEYLVISRDQETYAELSAETFDLCSTKMAGFCMDIVVTYPLSHPSCVVASFLDYHHDTIKAACDFEIHTKPLPPQIQIINATSYLLTNYTGPVRILCPRKSAQYLSIGPIVLVHLPCGCKLSLPGTSVDEASGGCTTDIPLSALHPLNFALFAHFNLTNYIDHPPTNVVKHTIPQIDLPDIKMLTRITHQTSNWDPRFGVSVNQVAEQAADVVDTSEIDMLDYDMEALDTDSWWSMPTITISACTAVWALLMTIGMILLAVRVHLVVAMMATQTGGARAYVITTSTMVPPSPIPEPINIWWHEDIMVQLTLIIMVTVIAGCAVVLLFHMCRKKLVRAHIWCPASCTAPQDSSKLDLFLKLTSANESAIVYVTTIAFEPGYTTITDTPLCTQAMVRMGAGSTLLLLWDRPMEYQVNGHNFQRTLPSRATVTSTIAARVRRITMNPRNTSVQCNLLCKAPCHKTYVSVPCPAPNGGFDPACHGISVPQAPDQTRTTNTDETPYEVPRVEDPNWTGNEGLSDPWAESAPGFKSLVVADHTDLL